MRVLPSSSSSSAPSEAQHHLDGALVLDLVVRDPQAVLHLPALVQQSLLAGLDPLSGLHHLLQLLHIHVGLDVVLVQPPFLVLEEHLDGGGLGAQQADLGAGPDTAGGEGLEVTFEGLLLVPDELHQPLPFRRNSHFVLDFGSEGAKCVLMAHHQAEGCPIQHSHVYLHDRRVLKHCLKHFIH